MPGQYWRFSNQIDRVDVNFPFPFKITRKKCGESREVAHCCVGSGIFKRPKNREDGSKLDDFRTKSIAPTRTKFWKIFERASERTNEQNKQKKFEKFSKKFSKSFRKILLWNIFFISKWRVCKQSQRQDQSRDSEKVPPRSLCRLWRYYGCHWLSSFKGINRKFLKSYR